MNKEQNCAFWFVIIIVMLCSITCCSSKPQVQPKMPQNDVYTCIQEYYAPRIVRPRPELVCVYNVQYGYAECECEGLAFIRTDSGKVIVR